MMINQKSPYFLYHLGRLSEIVAVFSLSSPMTPCSLPGSIIQWDVWTRSPCTLELVHPVLWHRVDFSTLESTTLPSLLPFYFNDFFFLQLYLVYEKETRLINYFLAFFWFCIQIQFPFLLCNHLEMIICKNVLLFQVLKRAIRTRLNIKYFCCAFFLIFSFAIDCLSS